MNPQDQINFFGKTNFRNRQVPFGIKTDDRRRHMYIIGKTGMGKTTLMENMVIQDIRNGNGVCFIDPHGDSIVKILDFVPNDRVNDVIYFNPADLDNPIAFNILEAVETRYKHLVASGLMGVFTKIWASMWSSRMEYILNNTILALLDSPGNTMLGIVRMYVDKKYRKKIVDNIKDPMVKAFWVEEFANYAEKYRTEAVAPIQNKVGQFLSSAVIRNIVGQPKSTIDLRDIMDNRKILLLDLSKGKVGEDNSALLGAMIITKLQLAALSRVDVEEKDRKDFYLYVDEFQNFVTDSFATILSEARKYRLNLTMGHQYIGQLTPEGNNKVRDAVFGNVGTMVVFRVGAADAEFLETEFEPIFTPTDIVNLPKYNIILKLMINGVASNPFTASTLQMDENWRTGNGEKVIKVSRERYANPKDSVEDKISRWMGVEFHEATAHDQSMTESDDNDKPKNKSNESGNNYGRTRNFDFNDTSAASGGGNKNPAIKISSAFLERMQRPQKPANLDNPRSDSDSKVKFNNLQRVTDNFQNNPVPKNFAVSVNKTPGSVNNKSDKSMLDASEVSPKQPRPDLQAFQAKQNTPSNFQNNSRFAGNLKAETNKKLPPKNFTNSSKPQFSKPKPEKNRNPIWDIASREASLKTQNLAESISKKISESVSDLNQAPYGASDLSKNAGQTAKTGKAKNLPSINSQPTDHKAVSYGSSDINHLQGKLESAELQKEDGMKLIKSKSGILAPGEAQILN